MAVVISSDLVLGDTPTAVPLSHPRILWDSILRRTGMEITPSSEDDDFPGANVADERTFNFWRPTSLPATLEIEIAEAEECDAALIAAHTIGTSEAAVQFHYHNGSGWVAWTAEVSPGSDAVLMFLNESVISNRFRLTVNGSGDSPEIIPSIGVVMVGKVLAMERGPTLDHKPITMQRKTVARPQIAERGALLGRSIQRQGVESDIEFQNLTKGFVRAEFDPFIEAARVHPFGWAWAPVEYPLEVAYLWLPMGSEDIHPEHAGLQDRMNVKFNVAGIVE